MNWFDAIVLGVVQGLTEFLPVSSSGHLVIFQNWLGVIEHNIVFDLAVHLGTVFSVVTIYRKSIMSALKDILGYFTSKSVTSGAYLLFVVVLGSIPTAIIGLTLKDLFVRMFSNIVAVSVCFIITGILLYLTKSRNEQMQISEELDYSHINSVSWWRALIIGTVQGFAIAPGISRSGSTIATGILLGLDRNVAAMYSFMLSIPAILGACLLQLKDIKTWNADFLEVLLVGVIVSYVAGLLGLKLVLKFVSKGRLQIFSAYLWTLAGVLLVRYYFFN